MSLKPASLRRNSTIGIVSVSAPEAAEAPDWFDRGIALLKRRGLRVVVSRSATGSHGYLSAPEKVLAAELMGYFADVSIDAIFCAGGGTNANRLLAHLDYELIQASPKILLGMSNPTVLLNAIHSRTGLVTFHGPAVVWNLGHPEGLTGYTESHLWPVLEGTDEVVAMAPTSGWRWLRPGKASGPLVGGNFISLQGLLGTRHEPEWDGRILFWEDVGKTTDRLDMILTHLRDAGVLDRIAGMVVGSLLNCDPPKGGQSLEAMLDEVLGDRCLPVLSGVAFGHTDDKLTLPIGCGARLDSESGVFQLTEAPVVAR